jgi:hypothetical protein
MLNLIISIISDTYARIAKTKTKSRIFERVSIIAEFNKLAFEKDILKII